MAEKRMLSRSIMYDDFFTEMSDKAQMLYVYLSLNADDDGFINSPRLVARSIGATVDHIDELENRKFIIYFRDENIVVIRHWFVCNIIRRDVYKETLYKNIKDHLSINESGIYNSIIMYSR